MSTLTEKLASISAMKLADHGKYSHKLDFDQRCEILALYRSGVGRAILSEAYKIDRRTVTHIYNPNSKHYRAVREEENKLGKDLFLQKYITENALMKLRNVKPVAQIPLEPRREGPLMKKSANKYAGVHHVKTDATDFEHRIIIQWREAELDNAGAGWYFKDADGADPERWLHNGDESRTSSVACLSAVRENLVDI